jgi:hypothetical protein
MSEPEAAEWALYVGRAVPDNALSGTARPTFSTLTHDHAQATHVSAVSPDEDAGRVRPLLQAEAIGVG